MRPRSATAARLFGLILIVLISAWDMDAMRPHIAAHSWTTLALVSLFLVVHLSDYLTVGRLVSRIDPLALAEPARMTSSAVLDEKTSPSLRPAVRTAKLYAFTAVTTTAAQVSGAPYPIAQQHFIVEAE